MNELYFCSRSFVFRSINWSNIEREVTSKKMRINTQNTKLHLEFLAEQWKKDVE